MVVLSMEEALEESMGVHDGKVKSKCAVGDERKGRAV